jgi:DNA-binding transcriptional LysR family regulator
VKIGRCTGSCKRLRVLVQVYRCGCGKGHQLIANHRNCTRPIADYVVRQHTCGKRLQPRDIRFLEGRTA